MLETIRQFGLERLAATGETEAVRRRHAHYYVRLAEESAPHLSGVRSRPWLAHLGAEQDNLRAALDWCAGAGEAGDPEGAALGLRLVAALWRFWSIRALAAEGRARLEGALAVAARYPAHAPAQRPALAEALHGVGVMARLQGDHDAARSWNAAPPCAGSWGRRGTWPGPSPPWAWPVWWTGSRRGPSPPWRRALPSSAAWETGGAWPGP